MERTCKRKEQMIKRRGRHDHVDGCGDEPGREKMNTHDKDTYMQFFSIRSGKEYLLIRHLVLHGMLMTGRVLFRVFSEWCEGE